MGNSSYRFVRLPQTTFLHIYRHNSAVQELCVFHQALCVCVCLYGFYKGSECGVLPFHRMSAVVRLWSTARPYIWSTEKIHQGCSLPLFSGPVFHRFVCTLLYFTLCVCACVIPSHYVVLFAPDILSFFWPHVITVSFTSRLELDGQSARSFMEGRKSSRNEESGKQGW